MIVNDMIFDFLEKCNFDKNSTILEIGAHMGFDTEKINGLCRESNIHCFEPDPRNIEILKERKINEIVNLHTFSIGDRDGKCHLYLSDGKIPEKTGNPYYDENPWTASNSIRLPKKHKDVFPWCGFERKIEIEQKKLDTFCEENKITDINFIWMDVQGCEDLVFNGGKKILQKTEYIYTEYSDQELYEGQKNLNHLLEILPGEWMIRNDYGGDVLLENLTYRDSLISSTGSWNIKNMNEHAFDEKLAKSICKITKERGLRRSIDFGCGPGEYVKYFNDNGIKTRGYDGNKYTKELTNGLCEVLDLTTDFNINPADFVICLEVGEHIPKEYENKLIENIIKHAGGYIIISWGIPGQGGYGHVNCRGNEYIIDKFIEKGCKYMKKESMILREESSMTWFKETLMMFKKIKN
jgi:FkbM family methyltransferase